MPKPHIFESRDHLVRALQDPTTLHLAQSFFAARTATVACITQEGVGGNTFRAFRKLPVKPSVAFRTWTAQRIEHTLPEVLAATERPAYAAYVHNTTLALTQYWFEHTGSEMGYGRGAKLLNLVLKKLACYATFTDEQRAVLIDTLHVPLDSYTIVGLRNVVPEFSIPKTATMKFITTSAQYNEYQALIASVAHEAGVPPIYYDILAWDRAH
jgi:hypothetical protein